MAEVRDSVPGRGNCKYKGLERGRGCPVLWRGSEVMGEGRRVGREHRGMGGLQITLPLVATARSWAVTLSEVNGSQCQF